MLKSTDRLDRRTFVLGVSLLALAPCLASANEARTPEEIVADLIDAMAVNDADRIAALFGENAQQAYGRRSPRTGAAFRDWLQSDIIAVHGRLEDAQLSSEGGTVMATGRYRNDNGYESDADFLFEIEEGRIIRWIVR